MYRVLILAILTGTVFADARAQDQCEELAEILGISDPPQQVDQLTQAFMQANDDPGACFKVDIVNDTGTAIRLTFSEPLPTLNGQIIIQGLGNADFIFEGGGAGSDFRFMTIGEGGFLWVDNIHFTGFHTVNDGGVFRVGSDATLAVTNTEISNNFAQGNGGVTSADPDSVVFIVESVLDNNTSGGDGGVVNSTDGVVVIDNSILSNNMADGNGGAVAQVGGRVSINNSDFNDNGTRRRGGAAFLDEIRTDVRNPLKLPNKDEIELIRRELRADVLANLASGSINSRYRGNFSFLQLANHARIRARPAQDGDLLEPEGFLFAGNVFSDPFNFVNTQYLRIEGGDVRLENNTFNVDPSRNQTAVTVVNFNEFRFGSNFMSGNAFGNGWEPRAGVDITGAACREIGTISGTPMVSAGFNVVADFTCPLDGPGDRPGTDPLFAERDENGVIALLDGSPAIDSGPSTVGAGGRLPCGHVDIRGVARPQDGNGDGTAACDAGAWEKHRGPDLGTPLTGLYFDVTRNGEGIVVEMLPGGKQALVYVFTYRPDGAGQAWMIGVGEVTHNSVVVNDLRITTSGTPFGAGFDPAQVERIPWGALSLSLPECAVLGAERGVLSLTGNGSLGFEALISRLNRLTWVVDCDGGQSPGARLSGSLFDPARDGEGLIVQILPDGRALVQVYTYGPSGEQFWIQGVGMLVNDTVSVDDAFFTRGPAYGSAFDPADLEIVPWGAFDIVFDGCAGATFAYDSPVPGFGSGMWNLVRLTEIDGAQCSQ